MRQIAEDRERVHIFNEHKLADVNYPDLIAAGLVTADSARSMLESVNNHAHAMVDSAVGIFMRHSRTFVISQVISMLTAYGIVISILSDHGGLQMPDHPTEKFLIFALGGIGLANVVLSVLYHSRQNEKATEYATGYSALRGMWAAFPSAASSAVKKRARTLPDQILRQAEISL